MFMLVIRHPVFEKVNNIHRISNRVQVSSALTPNSDCVATRLLSKAHAKSSVVKIGSRMPLC